MADATLKAIREFFDIPLKQFGVEWKELSDQAKTDIRRGIGDGTLTY